MADFFIILAGAALVNNIVVDQTVGTDPALAAARRYDVTFGLSRIILILLPAAVVCSALVMRLVLVPLHLQYLQEFIFVILIIMLSYGLTVWPEIWRSYLSADDLKVLLPFSGINTTVLGALLLNQQQAHSIIDGFFFALGTAVGFAVILAMLTAINQRMEVADIPPPFTGIGITLITLGMLSIAFSGFAGLGY